MVNMLVLLQSSYVSSHRLLCLLLTEAPCDDVEIDVDEEQFNMGDLALVVDETITGDVEIEVDDEQFSMGDFDRVVETTTGDEDVVVEDIIPFGVQSLE